MAIRLIGLEDVYPTFVWGKRNWPRVGVGDQWMGSLSGQVTFLGIPRTSRVKSPPFATSIIGAAIFQSLPVSLPTFGKVSRIHTIGKNKAVTPFRVTTAVGFGHSQGLPLSSFSFSLDWTHTYLERIWVFSIKQTQHVRHCGHTYTFLIVPNFLVRCHPSFPTAMNPLDIRIGQTSMQPHNVEHCSQQALSVSNEGDQHPAFVSL